MGGSAGNRAVCVREVAALQKARVAMPTFYEFFAGGGMARAGLGDHWNCVLANDIDEKKCGTYSANWGSSHLKVGDVAALTTADSPGQADLARASFPCQDPSLAGTGAGLRVDRSGTLR